MHPGPPRMKRPRQPGPDAGRAAGLAIEHVAARAGVGKATIYRWWPDRAALAVDAFFTATQDALAFPDTGSVREDFRQQVGQLGALLRTPAGTAMAAMAGGARHDPALGRALAERWIAPRKRWGVERMHRAIATGECPADLTWMPRWVRSTRRCTRR